MNSVSISWIIKILFLFSIYFLTAKLGLEINSVSGFATLIWMPTGISLAAVLMFGFRIWPAIALGAFFANLITGAPIPVAVGISFGNTMEALVAAKILELVGFRNSLERLFDALALIVVAALFSTTISATIGVISLILGGVITADVFKSTWIAWWTGDVLSNLVIAPFLLSWSFNSSLTIRKRVESMILISLLIFVGIGIFGGGFGMETTSLPITHIIFPPLILIAIWFSPKETTISTLILSIIAISATVGGSGPFVSDDLSKSLMSLQSFIGISAVTSLLLTSLSSEKRYLEKRKDEFISIASHELRTPLTSIKGYIQLMNQYMKENKKIGVLHSYILRMETEVKRLTQLVDNLLDTSKIQSDKLGLEKESFKLDSLTKEVIANIQKVTSHKIILKGKTKTQLFADKNRITQVLINLISNAIKFSPDANKIIVHLSQNKNNIEVSVEDFGMGIEEKNINKIFERFYQASSIKQQSSGLGLGLYIASDIVKKHGGKIWVKVKKGKGSIFTFSLPR